MSPLLTILNDLSWIIECVAMDHIGEGKSELGVLCKNLMADPAYAVQEKERVAQELEAARAAYVADDQRVGTHRLMEVSRRLWKAAATESEG